MPPDEKSVDTVVAIIQHRMTQQDTSIDELRKIVNDMADSFRSFVDELKQSYTTMQITQGKDGERINAAFRRIDETKEIVGSIDKRIDSLEKITESLSQVLSVLKWIAALIGASFIGLIWSVIIGQATITFN